MLLDGLIYKNASYFLKWKHDIYVKSQSDKELVTTIVR